MSDSLSLIRSKTSEIGFQRLVDLNNNCLYDFVATYLFHCEADFLYVCDDSIEDALYVREQAFLNGEEARLADSEHSIHFDGLNDQARDTKNTRYMVPEAKLASMASLNALPYGEAYDEIMSIAKGIMKGRIAILKIFCEGPTFSQFSIPCVQLSDSWYVIHSESILYRSGFEYFKSLDKKASFFKFVHSAGRLDDNHCSIDLESRRIYMDLEHDTVYSMNAQYAGNSVGMKKHAMRLAIYKSSQENWLCEHMFLMACVNKTQNRKTYFSGAFPSACGKTSTSMIPGEQIVGDDIAYIRNIEGQFKAVNVEQGIFGIIKDVNYEDDPVIFNNLTQNQEVIFSNVLVGADNKAYWSGMNVEMPKKGVNFQGDWTTDLKKSDGSFVPPSHGNARYTMRLDYLDNFDAKGFEDPTGILVQGVLYGGRDSNISVPIEESKDWRSGILLKACTLESETTSATLGQEGVLKASPMANLDFISYPLGKYVENNLKFGANLDKCPTIFTSNYFLKNENHDFCNGKLFKKVWLHWCEGRIHGDFKVFKTPTGYIPYYEDLKHLFKILLNEDYSLNDYRYQFTFRVDAWISKLERTLVFFKKMDVETPLDFIEFWETSISTLQNIKSEYGSFILPSDYQGDLL